MSRLKIKDVAAHLGVEPQSAGRLLRELNLTTADTLDRIRLAYIARLRAEASNANSSPERRELLVSRRRLLDLEYKRRMRELVPMAWGTRLLAGAGTAARAHLEVADRRIRSAHPDASEDLLRTVRGIHEEAVALIANAIEKIDEDEKEGTK